MPQSVDTMMLSGEVMAVADAKLRALVQGAAIVRAELARA